MELKLEVKEDTDRTAHVGPVSLAPLVDETYWLYRVQLTPTQAVLAFPKFGTIGIGFAQEEYWNTNLPYRCSTEQIYNHIEHNRGDTAITDTEIRAAIALLQTACHRLRGTDQAEMERGI